MIPGPFDDEELELTREAIFWKGQFLHRYGMIEFAISELCLRARQHAAYKNFSSFLPKKWSSKVQRLRDMIAQDGPLKAWAPGLVHLLDALPAYERFRHVCAHGGMLVRKNVEDDWEVAFLTYDFLKGKGLAQISWDLDTGGLQRVALAIAQISADLTALVAEICREVPLPLAIFSEHEPLLTLG